MLAKKHLRVVAPLPAPTPVTSGTSTAATSGTDTPQLIAAKEALGTRYLFHPANKVKKIKPREALSILDQHRLGLLKKV